MSNKFLLKYYWTDVFATEALAGNPLPVVIGADELDEATMKRIAREFNQAETTFVLRPSRPEATHRLRSFTAPGVEVFGAGHNALGAWLALVAGGYIEGRAPSVTLHQELGEHVLPVELQFDGRTLLGVVMQHSPPRFGAVVKDAAALAAALGLAPEDIALSRLPSQVVSTGAAHLLVPLRSRIAVDHARPDAQRLLAILHPAKAEGIYVFALDPLDPGASAYARFFNPTAGIYEDSATGTAAGPLAALLVSRGILPNGATVVVEQGHAMGRPSRLELRVQGDDVRLYGNGVVIGEGVLRI